MCGHGSNPGPGHPRPAAANAQTRTRDGVAPTHRRNARPLVRSVPRVVRSGPQPSRFAPDAARSPRRPPGPYRHGLRKSPADGGDLSRLRCTSAASNWTSWNRPGRGGRGCGRGAGRQGAPLTGRGRVDVVESLTAAEMTTGVDRTRWAGQRGGHHARSPGHAGRALRSRRSSTGTHIVFPLSERAETYAGTTLRSMVVSLLSTAKKGIHV